MDPIGGIHPEKDSTLAMMLGAQSLGASLYYMEQDDLYVKDGRACGRVRAVEVHDDPQRWFRMGEAETVPLGSLDVILMRKDPPADKRFLHTCAMLAQAARDGARVVNSPDALMLYNEKILATHFPEFCPPCIIASSLPVLQEFRREYKAVVVKPLDAMGGQGVFLVRPDDVNFEVIWESQTGHGTYPVEMQAFIPAVSEGDKRVIVIDGVPFGHALARLPREGSIRANLAAGGSYRVTELTAREREIAEGVGPRLAADGIVFAGLDIIGGFLTEVNITSPTCLRQISKGTGVDLGRAVMECAFEGLPA